MVRRLTPDYKFLGGVKGHPDGQLVYLDDYQKLSTLARELAEIMQTTGIGYSPRERTLAAAILKELEGETKGGDPQ